LKIIEKIALVFGVVFVVFAGLAALITYQIDKLEFNPNVPASFIQLGILMSALPFIAFAVVSFIAAGIIWKETKPKEEKLPETQTLIEEAKS
jgi:TRAP-type C4-dicarboxylate transport system permease small subunit